MFNLRLWQEICDLQCVSKMLPQRVFTMRFHEVVVPLIKEICMDEPPQKSKTVSYCSTSSFREASYHSQEGSFLDSARSTSYEQVHSISVSLSDTVVFPSGAMLILNWFIQKLVSRNVHPPSARNNKDCPFGLAILNGSGATMIWNRSYT